MEKISREKMVHWMRLFLSLILIFLCVSKSTGQEIGEEEATTLFSEKETTTVLDEETILAQDSPANSRIQFPKNRIPSGVSKRIIGGSIATPNAYPYQVALYISVQGSMYFCGGTLITPQWVLTAAHCVDQASSVQVILGAHDISQVEATRIVLNTSSFIIHEDWSETLLQNDIALIRLPQNVTLTSNITTVLVAAGTDLYSGLLGRCLGWGRTILGSLSSVLRYVDAEVTTNENCSSYEDYAPYIVDHHICTSGDGFVGSCNGDSGGPLIIDGVQVGIVSFGVTDCAAGLPSVFTRVTEFSSWITENIGYWNGTASENLGDHGGRIGPLVGMYVGLVLSVLFLNYL